MAVLRIFNESLYILFSVALFNFYAKINTYLVT